MQESGLRSRNRGPSGPRLLRDVHGLHHYLNRTTPYNLLISIVFRPHEIHDSDLLMRGTVSASVAGEVQPPARARTLLSIERGADAALRVGDVLPCLRSERSTLVDRLASCSSRPQESLT